MVDLSSDTTCSTREEGGGRRPAAVKQARRKVTPAAAGKVDSRIDPSFPVETGVTDAMMSATDRRTEYGDAPIMNPRSAQETSLLARVADGDPSAIKDVLSRYSALVWSLSSSLSKDPHEVEDVVQDIFVDVWRSAARYDPAVASEATFIATIARRRVIDRRRRAGRRVDPEPLDEELAPGADDEGLRQVDLDDEAHQARAAVAELSGDRRRVLEMSVVEGLTHREIAADTGIPLGTVKSHIRRGLAEVSEKLKARRSVTEDRT
jgi:RNA polymerase sigma factor (sigma-70 family)